MKDHLFFGLLLSVSIAVFIYFMSTSMSNDYSNTQKVLLGIPLFLISIFLAKKTIVLFKRNFVIFAFIFLICYSVVCYRDAVLNAALFTFIGSIIIGNNDIFVTKGYKTIVNSATGIFILNCLVSFYEYKNHVNIFYYDMSYFDRYRASGIWGHPLYSALITGGCMVFVLFSYYNKYVKIVLWLMGLFCLFTYDARAAVFSAIICSFLVLYFKGLIKFKNYKLIFPLLFVIYQIYNYLSNSDLGGKLFNADVAIAEDSYFRLIAFQMFADLDFNSMMIGVPDQFKYAEQYGVLCAENGFVGNVLVWGLPCTLIIFYLGYVFLTHLSLNKKYNLVLLIYFFGAGITNQSMLNAYIWFTYILLYFCFTSNYVNNENWNNNFSRLR